MFVIPPIALIIFFHFVKSENAYCKTSDGIVGKCLNSTICPQSKDLCGGNGQVCCALLERIVTPNVATPYPTPVVYPTQPPPSPLPTFATQPPAFPTFATAPPPSGPIGNLISSKCEEYKHRVFRRATIMTYVFGGSASLGKEFPHMAALGYGRPNRPEWLCGGSLISEKYILTAAHCLLTSNLGELVVARLGDLDLQSVYDDALPQDYSVIRKIPHPSYRPPSQYNDIGLVELDRPVQFNDYVAPICLEPSRNLPNTHFIATGWGRTEVGGAQSDTLMKVDLEYFPNEICRRTYEGIAVESLSNGIVDETQICAGSYGQERDTCQGDSGGPLQIRDDTLYLVGITSFGKACGVPNSPGVYTRVSYYVPWIEQIVWAS